MKSKGGLGREVQEHLSSSLAFIFSRSFLLRTAPYYILKTLHLSKLVCERGTICQLKVCNRSIEKGKGFDLRGYISVATKEIREETSVRRLQKGR